MVSRVNRRTSPASRAPQSLRRTLRASGLGIVAALALSACQWTSPITTAKQYDPSDGVSGSIGEVRLDNVLVISDKNGGPGTVVGMVNNGTNEPTQVSVSTLETGQQGGPAGAQVSVAPGQAAQLTPPPGQGQPLTLAAVPAPPGATVQLLIRSQAGQTVLDVPILPAEGPYKDYAPAGSTGAASPAPTQAPAPTATPTS